jgi:hypothetical protein
VTTAALNVRVRSLGFLTENASVYDSSSSTSLGASTPTSSNPPDLTGIPVAAVGAGLAVGPVAGLAPSTRAGVEVGEALAPVGDPSLPEQPARPVAPSPARNWRRFIPS